MEMVVNCLHGDGTCSAGMGTINYHRQHLKELIVCEKTFHYQNNLYWDRCGHSCRVGLFNCLNLWVTLVKNTLHGSVPWWCACTYLLCNAASCSGRHEWYHRGKHVPRCLYKSRWRSSQFMSQFSPTLLCPCPSFTLGNLSLPLIKNVWATLAELQH